MSKSNQVKKTRDLGPIPSFSIGLTQSEEEQGNVTRLRSGGDKNKERKSDETKGKEKKQYIKKNEKKKQQNEAQDSDEGKSDDENAKQRLRHKMSIPKVYDLMRSVDGKRRKNEIIGLLNDSGFGGLMHICNWTKVHTFFVDWVVKNFEKEHMWIRLSKTEVLLLKEDDVHRVYELPMAGKQIKVDLCSEAAIKSLRKELGLNGNYSASVRVTELERVLKTIEKPKAWVKGAICYIIHCVLCPTNSSFVSLQYAHILEDPAGVSSYNWCSHVLGYMKEGLQTPEVANPLADFHFLMINYMEKMGKRSPFLTGKYKRPSLCDWDVKTANQDLQKVHDLMGLEHGLTAGVTRLHNTDEGPLVLCFDANTCPLSEAEMHLSHCRSCIRIYTTAAETLERRIAEGDVGTSGQNDAVPKETNKPKDNPIKVQPTQVQPETDDSRSVSARTDKTRKRKERRSSVDNGQTQNESSIPQTSTRGEERLNDDKDVEEEIDHKIIDDDEEAEIDAKSLDDSVRKACDIDLSFTQETILKFPEFFNGGQASNAGETSNVNQAPVMEEEKPLKSEERNLKFPESFNGGQASNAGESVKTQCKASNVKQANLEGENPEGQKPLESDRVINAIPLRSVLPEQIINMDNVKTVQRKKRKKHDMLYSGGTYPERRRTVKKSKYFASPYDEAVYESNANKMQKDISTFVWSISHDEEEILYCSENRAHAFSLQRSDLWTLQKDEWVSCFVLNAWVNCLNWNQPNENRTRLVTPFINYVDLERPDALNITKQVACKRFIERLKKFKYMDCKAIDPTCLEYIMTPALNGNPGFHYVCFVVNLKSQKFQFLNSLMGETLHMKNGEATVYKKMFDVWLKEVEAFVTDLYKKRKIAMPFEFSTFKWETPRMPTQPDKDSCGVFCMKFLAEWEGGNTQMESFKDWSKMRKNEKKGKIMDFRIGICSKIITDTSNCRRTHVEKEATSYYEEMLQELARPT